MGCRPVIRAKWVKKAIRAVPNALVAPLAKRVPVLMVNVNNVPLVNHVHLMIQTRLRAYHVLPGLIKQVQAKRLVCRAYLARMKTVPVRRNVKIAALGNTKMQLAITRV